MKKVFRSLMSFSVCCALRPFIFPTVTATGSVQVRGSKQHKQALLGLGELVGQSPLRISAAF